MDGLKELFNKFSVGLISWAFVILGLTVILDILIIKNEPLKVGIIILFLLGSLYILSSFVKFLKNQMNNFFERKANKTKLIEGFKSLSKEEMRYVYKSYKEDINRFTFFDIVNLLQLNIFIQVEELDNNEILIKLNPIIKKHLVKVDSK